MPMGVTVSAELTALLLWLVAPPVIFGLLVVLYPPYLRRRLGKWRNLGRSVAAHMPASLAPNPPRETPVRERTPARSRTPQAPGA